MTGLIIVLIFSCLLAYYLWKPKKTYETKSNVVANELETKETLEPIEQSSISSKIEFVSNGPSGYVVYTDKDSSFKLYYEFGGGDCIASIYLPEDWEKETNTKLTEKNRILDTISKKVIAAKAPNSRAEMVDNKWLNIMKN